MESGERLCNKERIESDQQDVVEDSSEKGFSLAVAI
jgi:hypothetical protein